MAKTKARAVSFTEPQAETTVPFAWPFAQGVPGLVVAFARGHGLGGGTDANVFKTVSAHLDHRERIRSTLRGLTALEIVLLEILAEQGGRLTVPIVVRLAHARTGCSEPVVVAALRGLHERLLTAPLEITPPRGPHVPVAALLTPSAQHVAALVRGVSLPRNEPPAEAKPAAAGSSTRDLIAVTGLTAHRPLRYNLDGSPNRSQVTRFGKDLALPDASIERLLYSARSLGLVGAIGDAYAPVAAALQRFAAGIDDELDAWLPAASWASVDAIARASVRSMIDTNRTDAPMGSAAAFLDLLEAAATRAKGARGVDVVEAGGHAWIRRRSAGPSAGGDGHVTPSFEVLLGPRADLDVVAIVSLGCELVRLDRVLTYRITPASVAAGLTCGLAAPDFLGALDRVGRNPLPANVRTMVQDWIARRQTASIARAWVVRVPEAVADALARGDLAASIVDRPAPGVLALDPSVRRGDLVKHLAKQRVSLGPPIPLEDAIANRDEERWGVEKAPRARVEERPKALPRPLALPLVFEGDPALAEKVEAARATGFTPAPLPLATGAQLGPSAAAVPFSGSGASRPSAPAGPPPEAPESLHVDTMLNEARSLGLTPDLLAGLASLGTMYVDLLPELERWAERLPPAAQVPAREVLESPLALREFLVLAPKARQTVLGKASDVDRLLRESLRSRDFGRVSPRGAAAIPLLAEAERILATRRAVRGKAPVSMAPAHPQAAPNPGPAGRAPVSMAPTHPQAAPNPGPAGRAPEGVPAPPDLERQPEADVLAALQRACAKVQVVRLLVRSGDGTAVHTVIASAVQPRGATSALLAIDPETDEGRVFHLPDVLAVLPGS